MLVSPISFVFAQNVCDGNPTTQGAISASKMSSTVMTESIPEDYSVSTNCGNNPLLALPK
jgi:hypothetical protein